MAARRQFTVPGGTRGKGFLCTAALVLLLSTCARLGFCQSQNPYVVRVAHETSNDFACVIVDNQGSFHYENDDGQKTRVFEGEASIEQLRAVRAQVQKLSTISQQNIEEPLIHGPRNLLDIYFMRNGQWEGLVFRSAESQDANRALLKPLLQWMDVLHKLPHRELTEDEGKQNCQPKGEVRLKTRDEVSPSQREKNGTPVARRSIAPPPSNVPPPARQESKPMLRFLYFQRNSTGANQRCGFVVGDGRYRLETQNQKLGSKKVMGTLTLGELSEIELKALRGILDARELVNLKHRQPPGQMVPVLGGYLELSITRGSGIQELLLTDTTHRNNWFYAGDGDVSQAKSLLQFVHEHMESKPAQPLSRAEGNDCAGL